MGLVSWLFKLDPADVAGEQDQLRRQIRDAAAIAVNRMRVAATETEE